MDQPTTIVLFFAAILIFGGLLFAVITLTKRGPKALDVERFRSQWLAIEQSLKRDEVSSYHLCILNADKLLDKALRERHIGGATMGERMKQARTSWTNADAVWKAHKLRNRIAHETDVSVGYDETKRALASFRQALKDMRAI